MEIVNVTTKVGVGPATIIGYGLSALGLITGVIADLTENAGVLGLDNKWLVLAATLVAVVTNFGRQLQAKVAAPVPVIPVSSPVVVSPTIPTV
jgi:hypothetical protein